LIRTKIDLINNRISPIQDAEIINYCETKELNLLATLEGEEAYKVSDFIIISTPTNYDPFENYFDTTSLEAVIADIRRINPKTTICNYNYCACCLYKKYEKTHTNNIVFVCVFLVRVDFYMITLSLKYCYRKKLENAK